MLALAHTNVQFPTPGDFWSGTFGDFFAAIDTHPIRQSSEEEGVV